MTIISLFSTPIYHIEDVDYRLNCKEKTCINALVSSLYEDGNFFLSNDIYLLNNLAFRNIRDLCQYHLNTYTKEILKIRQDFYITNSWLTVKNQGQFHHKHNHQNCIFSGVFYVNANENMGGLSFHGKPGYLDNFNFEYTYDDSNIHNSSSWTIPVKTGTMIIFPSHLQHSVKENCADDSRIVIGFNSFVRGDLGMEDSSPYCSELSL